jgi:hypothetical protein
VNQLPDGFLTIAGISSGRLHQRLACGELGRTVAAEEASMDQVTGVAPLLARLELGDEPVRFPPFAGRFQKQTLRPEKLLHNFVAEAERIVAATVNQPVEIVQSRHGKTHV